MREIKVFTSPDRKRKLHLIDREDGFFSFEETKETTDTFDDLDFEVDPISYWVPCGSSGLYDSADVAEREARASIPWLSQISN